MDIFQNFKYSLRSKIIVIGLTFFLNLLIVRFLPVQDYAIYVLILAIVNFVGIFSFLGFGNAMQFFVSEHHSNNVKAKKYFGTGFSTIVIFSLISSLVIILFSSLLSNAYKIPATFFFLAGVFIFVRAIFGISIITLVANNKIKELSFANFLHTLSRYLIIIIIFLGFGAFNILIAELIVSFVIIIIAVFSLKKILSVSFNFSVFKDLFVFARKVVISDTIGILLTPLYTFVLGLFSLSSLAFFSAALKISYFFLLFGQSISTVFFPVFVYNRKNIKKIRNFIFILMRFIIIFFSFCLVNVIIFAKDILYIVMGGKYLTVGNILIIQCFAMVFEVFFMILFMYFNASKRPIYSTYSLLFKAIITITSLFVTIPLFLEYGATISLFISASLGNLLIYYYSKKIIEWSFPTRTFLNCIIAGFFCFLIVKSTLLFTTGFVSLVLGGFVSLSYFGFLILLKELKKDDLNYLKKIVF